MVRRLKSEGFWVRGVDIKPHGYLNLPADDFILGDLRDLAVVTAAFDRAFDEVYQFAADMGGAGYIFSGAHDVEIVHNSAMINLHVVQTAQMLGIQNIFFASSACVYPRENQLDPNDPNCEEASAYPANPDSEYGWEKLFSERHYLSANRQYGMNCKVARYHNIFGPYGTWQGGREKAPAAICRKVARAAPGDAIEIWGDGRQTRSFLYIDECIEASVRLMRSTCTVPVNIGSEEMISIQDLALMTISLSGKPLSVKNIAGPEGVRGRNSDNRLLDATLGWAPTGRLRDGMAKTYNWIAEQCGSVGQKQVADVAT